MSSNSDVLPQIWFAKVEDSDDSSEHPILEQLSSSERDRFQSIKSPDKRQEYLLSRTLMRHALSEQFRIRQQDWAFIEKPNTAPTIQNLPEGHWLSLSHSHGAICCVLHNEPIGIDIEQSRHRKNFSTLAKAFMNEDELERLHSNDVLMTDHFYKVWCAKEAFYKMMPAADQEYLYLQKIDYCDLTKGINGHLRHGNIAGYHLALVTNTTSKLINTLPVRRLNGSIQIEWT